jgi:general secretion pathway protein N
MMRFLQSHSLVSKVLAVVCMLLLAVIAMEIYFIETGTTVANAAALDPAQPSDPRNQGTRRPLYQAPAIVAYGEITERPLFTNTRKPPPVDDAPQATVRADQLSKRWRLTGVILAAAESYVHVENVRERRTERLKIGALLNGWRLDEIFPDRVILISNNEDVTLELHKEKDAAEAR